MSARARVWGLILAGLAFSVGIKLATGGTPMQPERQESVAVLATFLDHQGFGRVPLAHTPPMNLAAFRRDGCEMLAGVVNLIGSEERVIEELTPPGWTISYVFQGVVYDTAPKTLALTQDYLSRGRWLFDRGAGFDPIVATVHNTSCRLDALAWQDLGHVAYRQRSFGT